VKNHLGSKPDIVYMEYGGIKNDPTYAIRSFEAKRGRVLETQPGGTELSNPQYNEPCATPREGLGRGQSEISPRITPRGTQTSLVNPTTEISKPLSEQATPKNTTFHCARNCARRSKIPPEIT